MTAEGVSALILAGTTVAAGVGWIFRVGGRDATMQIQIAQHEREAVERDSRLRLEQSERYQKLLDDINGIGTGLRRVEAQNSRRYHNVSLALTHVAPPEKESNVVGILKED